MAITLHLIGISSPITSLIALRADLDFGDGIIILVDVVILLGKLQNFI